MTVQEAVDILKRTYNYMVEWTIVNRINLPEQSDAIEAIQLVIEALDINKVSRLEVISYENGREYVNWNKEWTLGIEESLQDDGRTLKIFIKN